MKIVRRAKSKFRKLWRVGFKDTLIGSSTVVLLACVAIALVWGHLGGWPELGDLNVEFWGLIFDVLVILVGFGIIQYRKQKRDDIARHEEVIEDLKRWGSDEAKHRIFGAMRRLNKLGKTNFELSGALVKNTSFAGFGVSSISGSTLSSGGRWMDDEITASNFEAVDFSRLDARNVVFESYRPLESKGGQIDFGRQAIYTDCDFWHSDLSGAKFNGAKLFWSNAPPSSVEEFIDEAPNGQPIYMQNVFDRFIDADLFCTSFKGCVFKWADFRRAKNIETADFSSAIGLETCAFDNAALKQSIIKKSKEKPS